MSATPRHAFPYVLQSQSQKEVTHNAALNRLDGLVQPAVEDMDVPTPPVSPGEGELWIVAAGADGDWTGHDGELAQFIGGTWTFYRPVDGAAVWLKDEHLYACWTGAGWERGVVRAVAAVEVAGERVLGSRQAAIPNAAGGVIQDAEARAAINALLAACRNHGLIYF